jgi:hypothetical protein
LIAEDHGNSFAKIFSATDMIRYFNRHKIGEVIPYVLTNEMAMMATSLNDRLWLAGDENEDFAFIMSTDIPRGIPPIVRELTAALQIEPPLNAVGPFRYWDDRRKRTFWQTVQHWWETLRWEPFYIHYRPVQPGDPDYDYAPYEETWVWLRPEGTGYVEAPKVSVSR